MEFRQLETLIAIKNAGSFAQAAENMGYTQPTLTSHIQALERQLKCKLFERLGHRVRLTHKGEQFIVYAERILKLRDEATQSIMEKPDYSKIVIGVSETFSVVRLPLLLKEFRKEFPLIEIELKFGDMAKFSADLKDNIVDIAVVLSGEILYPHLAVEILCPEPMALIAPVDHPLSLLPEVHVVDFAASDFIVTQEGCAYRSYIEELLSSSEIKPRSFLKVKNIEAIKQFVMSGLGLAILPRIYVEKEIKANMLVELPWSGIDFGMYTQVVYHKDKWLSPAINSFLELIRTRINV